MADKKIKIIFIHHSTGANLINQGKVRELLAKKNPDLEFWDHGYSYRFPQFNGILDFFYPHIAGLNNPKGQNTGIDNGIKLTNDSPQGYEDLFTQNVTDPPSNALSQILKYDVVIFKSCFPVTKIETDDKLESYKKNYLAIRATIDKYPDKLFILFTPPPLRREMTNPEYAKRARIYANWLKSKEYLGERKNIRVFDFFDLLSENNFLKKEYCPLLPFDSHPNKFANELAGRKFVELLSKVSLT